jgi:hypothetical protein
MLNLNKLYSVSKYINEKAKTRLFGIEFSDAKAYILLYRWVPAFLGLSLPTPIVKFAHNIEKFTNKYISYVTNIIPDSVKDTISYGVSATLDLFTCRTGRRITTFASIVGIIEGMPFASVYLAGYAAFILVGLATQTHLKREISKLDKEAHLLEDIIELGLNCKTRQQLKNFFNDKLLELSNEQKINEWKAKTGRKLNKTETHKMSFADSLIEYGPEDVFEIGIFFKKTGDLIFNNLMGATLYLFGYGLGTIDTNSYAVRRQVRKEEIEFLKSYLKQDYSDLKDLQKIKTSLNQAIADTKYYEDNLSQYSYVKQFVEIPREVLGTKSIHEVIGSIPRKTGELTKLIVKPILGKEPASYTKYAIEAILGDGLLYSFATRIDKFAEERSHKPNNFADKLKLEREENLRFKEEYKDKTI